MGMFHLKGSGSPSQPVVVSAFGDEDLDNPSIDGDGFQAAILIYNDSHITIEHLTLTNESSHLDENGVVKKLPTFLGETNDWGSGKNVRFGIKVVADIMSLEDIVVKDVFIHDIYPTPTNQRISMWAMESSSKIVPTPECAVNTIDDITIEDVEVTRTGHYGLWSKPLTRWQRRDQE